MLTVKCLFLLATAIQLTYTRTYDSSNSISVKKAVVKYAGPMVYSGLPPPVVYFPTMPKIPKNMISNSESSSSRPVEYIPLPYQDLPVLIYQSKQHPPIHVVHNVKHGIYSNNKDNGKGYLTSASMESSQEGGRGFGKYATNYDEYDQAAASETYSQIASYSQLPSNYDGYKPTAGYSQASDTYSRLPSGYQSQGNRYSDDYQDQYSQSSEKFSPATYSAPYGQSYTRQYPRGYGQLASYQTSYEPQLTSNSITQLLKGVNPSPSSAPYHAEESYIKPIVSYPPTTLEIFKGSNYGYGSRGIHSIYQPKPIFLTSTSSSNAVYIPHPPSHSKPGDVSSLGGRYGSRDAGTFTSMSAPAPHIIYTGHPPIHVFPQPIIVKEAAKPSESNNVEEEEPGNYAQASEEHSVAYGGYKGNSDDSYNKYKGHNENYYENEGNSGYESGNMAYSNHGQPTESSNSPSYSETTINQAPNESPSSASPHSSYGPVSSNSGGGGGGGGRGKLYLSGSGSSGGNYENNFSGYNTGNRYPPTSYDLGLTSNFGSSSNLFGNNAFPFGSYETLKLRPSNSIMGRLTALGSSLFVRRPFGLSSMFTSYRPTSYYLPSNFQSSANSFGGNYRPSSSNIAYTDHVASASQTAESYDTDTAESSDDISYPQVNYKVPPTGSTAAPHHRKPPIIIYQGIRPPVYVYGQTAQDKNDEASNPSPSFDDEKDLPSSQAGYEEDDLSQTYHQPTYNQQNQQEHLQQGEFDNTQQQSTYEATPVNPDDYESESDVQNYDTNAVERADHIEESEEPAHPQDPTDRSGWVPINFPEDQKDKANVEGRVGAEIRVA